ncbi:MAG: aspartate kinase, partial [Lutispora sp.]|nr:aspartate kinase [Lutispora sp.]
MPIIVQKYGGSSIETIEKIRNVAKRIGERKEKGFDLVVVVSAMGKTTDYLIEMAHQVSHKP